MELAVIVPLKFVLPTNEYQRARCDRFHVRIHVCILLPRNPFPFYSPDAAANLSPRRSDIHDDIVIWQT